MVTSKEKLTAEERAFHKSLLRAAVDEERWGAAAFHLSLFVGSDRPGGVGIELRCLCRRLRDGGRPQALQPDPCCPFHGEAQHRAVPA